MICRYFFEFIVFSCLGWVYECTFCTLKTHKWQNRGFLFGPVCPIYGSCVVAGDLLLSLIHGQGQVPVAAISPWKIFLVSMVGSAVVEYVTSYVLEKRFHARWWDYSKLPLNLQGRISLPTSVGFGLAGVLIAKLLYQPATGFFDHIPSPLLEILALASMGVLAADLALTEANLHDLLERIKAVEDEVNQRMESRYQKLEEGREQFRDQFLNERVHAHGPASRRLTSIQHNIMNNMNFPHGGRAAILEKLQEAVRAERQRRKSA